MMRMAKGRILDLGTAFRELHRDRDQVLALEGDVLGYFDGAIELGPDKALDLVRKKALQGGLIEAVRLTVGSFTLVQESESGLRIVTSPAGPGVYLVQDGDRATLTPDEREMAALAVSGGLEDMEVLHFLFAKPSPSCQPFSTIFRMALRLPGGVDARITADGSVHKNFYIHTGPDVEDTYELFKRTLLACTGLWCKAGEGLPLAATLSGGVDSAVVLLAALELGFQPRVMHWRKSKALSGSIALLCDLAGVSPEYFGKHYFQPDPLKTDWNRAQELFSSTLGIRGFNHLLAGMTETMGTVLTGLAFGNIFQINQFTRPVFGLSPQERMTANRQGRGGRSLFTRTAIRAVQQGKGKELVERLARITDPVGTNGQAAPRDLSEYLFHLVLSNKSPLASSEHLPPRLRENGEAYARHVRATAFPDILGSELLAVLDKDGGRSLGDREALRAIRLPRFALQVQRTAKTSRAYSLAAGYRLATPPMEGPMFGFCMGRPLTIREVLFPKHYLYRYFKEQLGISYTEYLDRDRENRLALAGEQAQQRGGQTLKSNEAILFESPDFKRNFPKLADPSASAALAMMQDPGLRDSVARAYAECRDNPADFPLCNQIANLEIFLRTL